MRKLKISEKRERELIAELELLRKKISEANNEHGISAAEEKGLFRNTAARIEMLDIERWNCRIEEILYILDTAEIVKIDLASESMVVELGDLVTLSITYQGKESIDMVVQIAGTSKTTGVYNLTYNSPLAQRILGKRIGETFESRPSDKVKMPFSGTVTEITKAKNLVETEGKKPYVLK